MIAYFIKANIALAVLYLAVRLVSGKDTLFAVRRAALLSAIVFALLYPMLRFPQLAGTAAVAAGAEGLGVALEQITVRASGQASSPLTSINVLLGIYLLGVGMLLIRFTTQLYLILRLKRDSMKITYEGTVIHVPAEEGSPFSFCGWIFADPGRYGRDEFADIIAHEKTHVRQFHSFDVILSELVRIFMWINPAAWMLKADLHRNLEYLADRHVVAAGSDRRRYQYNLLKLTYNGPRPGLTNNFNQSQLKKRIVMMNKRKSPGAGSLKYALLLPALMLVLTAFNTSAQGPGNNGAETLTLTLNPEKTRIDDILNSIDVNDVESLSLDKGQGKSTVTIKLRNDAEASEVPTGVPGAGTGVTGSDTYGNHKHIQMFYAEGGKIDVFTESSASDEVPQGIVDQLPPIRGRRPAIFPRMGNEKR